MPRAVIFGLAGPALTPEERRLFADADPLGFILFARNCRDPEQVRTLVADLRQTVGRGDAPVLIDQEGGRVQRLGPPHWRAAPCMGRFADLAARGEGSGDYRGEALALRAAWLNARLIAAELADLGITVDCAPVLDISQPGADPVIGDRACGRTPEQAALIGAAVCSGLLDGGITPVIKHIPGHGRATVDSHHGLPVVTAGQAELEAVDFAPFAALAAMPWAMTAHVIYDAWDEGLPATISPLVIGEVIRGRIGFDGVLLSDDIGMGALSGTLAERAEAALAAGCDVVLHCEGDLKGMRAVAAVCGPISPATVGRLARARTAAPRDPVPFAAEAARAELAALLGVEAV